MTISAETEKGAVNQVKDMLDIGQIILVAEDFFDREIESESV